MLVIIPLVDGYIYRIEWGMQAPFLEMILNHIR